VDCSSSSSSSTSSLESKMVMKGKVRRGSNRWKRTKQNYFCSVGDRVPRFIAHKPDNQPYEVVQGVEWYGDNTPLQQSASFINLGFVHTLSQVSQSAQMGAVFDQYRIAEIEMTFRPAFTTGVSNMRPPLLYLVVDLDDSVPLSGGSAPYLAYDNCSESQFETVVMSFVPHCTMGVLDNTGVVAAGNITAPWLDMADSAVEHFGVKLGMGPLGTAIVAQAFTITSRFRLQLRNFR